MRTALLAVAFSAALPASLFAAAAAPGTAAPGAATRQAPGGAKRPQMAAYVGAAEGQTQVLLDGIEPWIDAKEGQQLTPGTQVRTRGASTLTIIFTDGTKVRLGPNASFKIEETKQSKIALYVGLGKFEAWVKKLSGRTFQVRNPVSVASVRGTVFAMNVFSPTRCSVDLFSGALAIMDNFGRTTSVDPGQRVDADASKGASEPEPLPPGVTAPSEPSVTLADVVSTGSGDSGDSGEEAAAEEAAADGEGEGEVTAENTTGDTGPTQNTSQEINTVSSSSP